MQSVLTVPFTNSLRNSHLDGLDWKAHRRSQISRSQSRQNQIGATGWQSHRDSIDAIESQSEGEVETLALLTQDRSEMMTRIRHNYFTVEGELKNEDRNFVLDITMLLENVVHTLARYGQLLGPEKSV